MTPNQDKYVPMWEVRVSYKNCDGEIRYGYLSSKDRTAWKTKRIAEKHAREYSVKWLMDSWVEEV